MNVEEKLRNAFSAYYRIEPSPDALHRLEAGLHDRSPGRSRAWVMSAGLAVILATGSIIAVRLVSDQQAGQIQVVTPIQSPSGLLTPASPAASATPSVSPSAQPTQPGKTHFVSEDGVWEFWYPKSWFGPTTGSRAWAIQNYKDNPASVPLAVYVSFSSYENFDNLTFSELQEEICVEDGSQEILECRTEDINGRTWIWVVAYSEVEGPTKVLRVATISASKIFDAIGYVPGKSGHEPGIKQISEVFGSFILHTD